METGGFLNITQMQESHVDEVVQIHLESFEGFFLSFLGRDFLRLFYRGVCRDQRAIKLVALSNTGETLGFAVGVLNPSGFFSGLMKRDWWRFSLASARALISRPSAIPRVARALLYPSQNPAGEDMALFISLGVSVPRAAASFSRYAREMRRAGAGGLSRIKYAGAGRELVAAFYKSAADRGAKKVYLHTDADNHEVIRLHESLGCHRAREYVTREGRRMYEYVYETDLLGRAGGRSD